MTDKSYEAWRCTFQSSEQAARSAYNDALKLADEADQLEKYRQFFLGAYATDDLVAIAKLRAADSPQVLAAGIDALLEQYHKELGRGDLTPLADWLENRRLELLELAASVVSKGSSDDS